MARGKSGRIVIEIDPDLKRKLYLELEKRQLNLKNWFLAEANKLVYNGEEDGPASRGGKKSQSRTGRKRP